MADYASLIRHMNSAAIGAPSGLSLEINVGQRLLVVIAHNEAPGAFLDRPGRLEAGLRGHGLMIHQREHDFGYGDKADRERDNGDGELITDHLPASLHHDHEKGRPFETPYSLSLLVGLRSACVFDCGCLAFPLLLPEQLAPERMGDGP